MRPSELLISVMAILMVFNFIYIAAFPDIANTMILGSIIGLVVTVLIVCIVGGVQVLGSGLSGTSIKMIFGIAILFNILFQINLPSWIFGIISVVATVAGYGINTNLSIPIGMGLTNNIFNAFANGDLWGLGFFVATTLSIVALVSGIMVIMGASGES